LHLHCPTLQEASNVGLQLRRAISIQAEGKKLLEKDAIAPSAARLCYAAMSPGTRTVLCRHAEDHFSGQTYPVRLSWIDGSLAFTRFDNLEETGPQLRSVNVNEQSIVGKTVKNKVAQSKQGQFTNIARTRIG